MSVEDEACCSSCAKAEGVKSLLSAATLKIALLLLSTLLQPSSRNEFSAIKLINSAQLDQMRLHWMSSEGFLRKAMSPGETRCLLKHCCCKVTSEMGYPSDSSNLVLKTPCNLKPKTDHPLLSSLKVPPHQLILLPDGFFQ